MTAMIIVLFTFVWSWCDLSLCGLWPPNAFEARSQKCKYAAVSLANQCVANRLVLVVHELHYFAEVLHTSKTVDMLTGRTVPVVRGYRKFKTTFPDAVCAGVEFPHLKWWYQPRYRFIKNKAFVGYQRTAVKWFRDVGGKKQKQNKEQNQKERTTGTDRADDWSFIDATRSFEVLGFSASASHAPETFGSFFSCISKFIPLGSKGLN